MIYMHKHHIIPKHMGGTDDPNNLLTVNVTLHAFLHKLLWEEHGNWQDLAAWKGLSGQTPYRVIDEEIEKERSRKISEALTGKTFSVETKEKMSRSAKKRANTIEGQKRLKEISTLGRGMKRTEKTKDAISDALKGKSKSEAHKNNLRKSKKVKLGWFTDGTNNLKLRLTDLVPQNYYRGRTFKC